MLSGSTISACSLPYFLLISYPHLLIILGRNTTKTAALKLTFKTVLMHVVAFRKDITRPEVV